MIENDLKRKPEPAWDPEQHPGSWRAVWAYSTKRAVRDNKTLTLQENRAKEGSSPGRTPRFVKNSNGTRVSTKRRWRVPAGSSGSRGPSQTPGRSDGRQ